MEKTIRVFKFGWRLWASVSLRRVIEVKGINSRLDPETHFLMWDFDGVELKDVQRALRLIQAQYGLPPVHILNTGKEGGYHAYCFKACSWVQARTIIAATPNVDDKYLAVAIGRGYFTLRFSKLPNRDFEPCRTLESGVRADVDYSDISCMVRYTKAE